MLLLFLNDVSNCTDVEIEFMGDFFDIQFHNYDGQLSLFELL